MSAIDKKKVLDALSKNLDKEVAAPLLDALAATATTKTDLFQKIGSKLQELQSVGMTESNERMQRQGRIQEEEEAFKTMDPAARSSYVQDKML